MSTEVGMTAELASHGLKESNCEIQDSRYQGKGSILYSNENRYDGNLQKGKLHGLGCYQWKDNVKYTGEFKFNVVQGTGTYEWPDGSKYYGELKDGKRHGKGIHITSTGVEYRGEWRNGLKEGVGVLFYDRTQQHYYEGEFLNGRKNGWGRIVYSSGSMYEGTWEYDKMNGYGVMEWNISGCPSSAATGLFNTSQGREFDYRPSTQESTQCDVNSNTTASSFQILSASIPYTPSANPQTGRVEKYEGGWQDGSPHGYGTYSWMCKNKPSNKTLSSSIPGTQVGSNIAGLETPLLGENTYQGWFKDGKRHGTGVLSLADGVAFEGNWVENVKEGDGIIIHPDGCVEQLSLINNVIKSKTVLLPGVTGKKAGDIKRCHEEQTQGLTVSESGFSTIGLNVTDIIDCPENRIQAEHKKVSDLVLRHISSLKYLYRFYAGVGPAVQVRTPADEHRDRQRSALFRQAIDLKTNTNLRRPSRDIQMYQGSAEEAAFQKEVMFLKRYKIDAPDYKRLSRREALLMQLHEACHIVMAESIVLAEQSEDAEIKSNPDIEYSPIRSLVRHPCIISSPPAAETPPTLLKLHQLWALLNDAGVLAYDFSLYKCNRVIASVVSQQQLRASEDFPTTLWNDSATADEESNDIPNKQKNTQQESNLTPTTAPKTKKNRTGSSVSQHPTETPIRRSSKDSTQSKPASNVLAKVNRIQLCDPDDPLQAIYFVPFVNCIVRLAHAKSKYTSGHAYNSISKGLSLCEQVVWFLATFMQPIIDSLAVAGISSVGPALGISVLPHRPVANLTHKSGQLCSSKPKARLITSAGTAKEDHTLSRGKHNTSSRGFNQFRAERSSTFSVDKDAGSSQTTPRSQSAFDVEHPMTDTFNGTGKRVKTTIRKEREDKEQSNEPLVSTSSRSHICPSGKNVSCTITQTNITSHGSVQPDFIIYTECVNESGFGNTTTDQNKNSTGSPTSQMISSYGSACIGIETKSSHASEQKWSQRHTECWDRYTDAQDVVEEWNHQNTKSHSRHSQTTIEQEASSTSSESHISLPQFEAASRITNSPDLPILFASCSEMRTLLKSQPVLEIIAKESESLIQLYKSYKESPLQQKSEIKSKKHHRHKQAIKATSNIKEENDIDLDSKFTVRSLMKIFRDYGILGWEPVRPKINKQSVQLKSLVCRTTKNSSDPYFEQLEKELKAASVAEDDSKPINLFCYHSLTSVLRPILWFVMRIDPDSCFKLRTRTESQALLQEQEREKMQVVSMAFTAAVSQGFEKKGSSRSMISVTATERNLEDSTNFLGPGDRKATAIQLRSQLAARDEMRSDPTWFLPKQSGASPSNAHWENCIVSLPLLYHEFVESLVITAAIVYTSHKEPLLSNKQLAVNDTLESELPKKFSLLLQHLSGPKVFDVKETVA